VDRRRPGSPLRKPHPVSFLADPLLSKERVGQREQQNSRQQKNSRQQTVGSFLTLSLLKERVGEERDGVRFLYPPMQQGAGQKLMPGG